MDDRIGSEIRVFPDLDAISRAVAEEIVAEAEEAVSESGVFTLVLAGGKTPRTLYRLLAGPFRDKLPWERVHLFWGDERYVPHTDPLSNYAMVQETLLNAVHLPEQQVHPMPTHAANPDDAARAYEERLRSFFGGLRPRFDLVLLGMGADGHTASLFPGTGVVEEEERWVVQARAPVEPAVRLSLTRPVLTAASQLLFLVTGSDKQPVWRRIEENPAEAVHQYPAARVAAESENTVWLIDEYLARP